MRPVKLPLLYSAICKRLRHLWAARRIELHLPIFTGCSTKSLSSPFSTVSLLAGTGRFELPLMVLETIVLPLNYIPMLYFWSWEWDSNSRIVDLQSTSFTTSDISTYIYNIKNGRFADFKVKLKSQPLCFASEDLTAKSVPPIWVLPNRLSYLFCY